MGWNIHFVIEWTNYKFAYEDYFLFRFFLWVIGNLHKGLSMCTLSSFLWSKFVKRLWRENVTAYGRIHSHYGGKINLLQIYCLLAEKNSLENKRICLLLRLEDCYSVALIPLAGPRRLVEFFFLYFCWNGITSYFQKFCCWNASTTIEICKLFSQKNYFWS